ncbi:MAG: YjfB family protein [Synergistaceae bacterium]|nr:YjfB family protein [Synergistaceae bacterium]
MDITNDIARYSMEMATTRAATQANVAMLKKGMEIEQDTMSQLLASMGMGGSLNVQG